MSNKLSGTLTLRLPSGDNRFKAFFNVGESGFATEEYVKQLIAESEKKEEGKYVEKTDIQDTLNSDNSNKPLSANQGKVLKGLLDAKVIEAGAVPMDSEPTEGNINNVVTSDGLAKEFNKSNTKLAKLEKHFKKYIKGKALLYNGTLYDQEGTITSIAITIKSGSDVIINRGNDKSTKLICGYHSDGSFVDYWTMTTKTYTFIASKIEDKNIAYLRISFDDANSIGANVVQNGNVLWDRRGLDNIVDDIQTNTKENKADIDKLQLHFTPYIVGKSLWSDGSIYKDETCSVSAYVKVQRNYDVIIEGNRTKNCIICGYSADGSFIDYWTMTPGYSYTLSSTKIASNNIIYVRIVIDNTYLTTTFITQNGVKIWDYEGIEGALKELYLQNREEKNAYSRNNEQEQRLLAACRYNKQSNKDFQFAIITDEHADLQSITNVIDMANGFNTIDAVINCGDLVGGRLAGEESVVSSFYNIASHCTKPVLTVVGNHDVGNSNKIGYIGGDHDYVHNIFIKPLHDNNWLNDAEYSLNKNYYYKDFDIQKIRMIVLYQYDNPFTHDDNDENWESVTYNSTYSNMVNGANYSAGQLLNMPNYKVNSFKAKQTISSYNIEKSPVIKVSTGSRIIAEEQMNWFMHILASTPNGYNIVVAMHTRFSDNATKQTQYRFQDNGAYDPDWGTIMTGTILGDIAQAFNNRTLFNKDVVGKGDFSYVNQGGKWYTLNYDFRNITTSAKILLFIGGHTHYDTIWKDSNGFVQICPICSSTNSAQNELNDIRRSTTDGKCYDSITVVSVRQGSIPSVVLSKIGVDITENGTNRDFEVIEVNS